MKFDPHFCLPWVTMAAALLISQDVGLRADPADEAGVQHVSLPTNEFIEKAEFYYWKPQAEIKAVLLLCPGKNGNGEGWIKEVRWRQFAEEQRLLLCGLWFVSKTNYPLPDYSDARSVSGKMVLDALKTVGAEKRRLLMYGFSAGARFTASFAEKYPDKMLAWAACAVGQWIPPVETASPPPGIVACGERDAGNFWASLQYFQQARKLGRAWTWVSVPKVGHQRSPEFETFVRSWFTWRLGLADAKKIEAPGEWRDIDAKNLVTNEELLSYPIFASWLPNSELAAQWENLHTP